MGATEAELCSFQGSCGEDEAMQDENAQWKGANAAMLEH